MARPFTYSRFSRQELDRLYSPSQFSRRFSADEIVDQHIAAVRKATREAQSSVKCELGVKYDSPDGPTLDLYFPEGNLVHSPVFIYIHGGYWQALGVELSGYMALPLTNNGVTVVALGYDLAPKASMTTIVEQCRRGCAYVAKRFSENKIFVGGHSAGGHLAATCMMVSDWGRYGLETGPFAGAVLISGVFDLKPIQLSYVNEPLQLTDSEVDQFSPLGTLASLSLSHDFKCLVAVGEYESPEFKRQSEEYAKALCSAGISCSHDVIPGRDHFDVTELLAEEDYQLTQMILKLVEV